MFRGKESSNRIKLSRLVQELLNFGVLSSLQLWGWWVGFGWVGVVGGGLGGGGWGCPHTCAHAHMHVHTHTCSHGKHDNFMQMAAPIGGIPGNFLCHMHVHVCVGGRTLSPPLPTSTHPLTPRGDPWNQSKFNST